MSITNSPSDAPLDDASGAASGLPAARARARRRSRQRRRLANVAGLLAALILSGAMYSVFAPAQAAALLSSQVKLGASASAAAGPKGRDASASTTSHPPSGMTARRRPMPRRCWRYRPRCTRSPRIAALVPAGVIFRLCPRNGREIGVSRKHFIEGGFPA